MTQAQLRSCLRPKKCQCKLFHGQGCPTFFGVCGFGHVTEQLMGSPVRPAESLPQTGGPSAQLQVTGSSFCLNRKRTLKWPLARKVNEGFNGTLAFPNNRVEHLFWRLCNCDKVFLVRWIPASASQFNCYNNTRVRCFCKRLTISSVLWNTVHNIETWNLISRL